MHDALSTLTNFTHRFKHDVGSRALPGNTVVTRLGSSPARGIVGAGGGRYVCFSFVCLFVCLERAHTLVPTYGLSRTLFTFADETTHSCFVFENARKLMGEHR